MTMTPEQKVKILILALDARWQQKEEPDAAAHRPEFREPSSARRQPDAANPGRRQ
jgi:hypothetical protein